MISSMDWKITIDEPCRGIFYLRVLDDKTDQRLSSLFFREGVKLSGGGIAISDLYTKEPAKGYGTFAVNAFIQFCQAVYLEDIPIYGSPSHPGSEDDRKRRNKFWEGFGFSITLDRPNSDRMTAWLSDLNCKINHYFQPLHQCKISILRHQGI